jgi:hypothetical protein
MRFMLASCKGDGLRPGLRGPRPDVALVSTPAAGDSKLPGAGG